MARRLGAALIGLMVGVAVFVAVLAGWGWWHAHMEPDAASGGRGSGGWRLSHRSGYLPSARAPALDRLGASRRS